MRARVLLWRSRPALLALALAAAGLGVVGALRPTPPSTVDVLVVVRAVAAGAVLVDQDVTVRALPAVVAPQGVATQADAVVGRVAAVDLTAGTPLVPGVLVAADATGPPGTVVATVRLVDQAAADLLRPGMRVDVLAAVPDEGEGRLVATRALVLPTPPSRSDDAGLAALGPADDAAPPVLLAVTPDEARALAGASATALLSAVVVP
nr:SAF domain-containing protein [Cellulomonas septica]